MILVLFFVREDSYLAPSSGGRVRFSTHVSTFPINEGWRQFQIDKEHELWIHHIEATPPELEWQYLQQHISTNRVRAIYIALHSTGMKGMEKDIRQQVQQYFPKITEVIISLFSREREKAWATFSDLMVSKYEERIKLFDKLCETIKKNLV